MADPIITRLPSRVCALDLAGQTFGSLTVLHACRHRGQHCWVCRCVCGRTNVVSATRLRRGNTKSCGCRRGGHRKRIDLTGQRFGALTVLSYSHTPIDGRSRWNCQCDCGATKVIAGQSLRAGTTRSCGCQQFVLIAQAQRRVAAARRATRVPLTKLCAHCGTAFMVKPCELNNSRRRFCSRQCGRTSRCHGVNNHLWRGGSVTMPCGTCGRPVSVIRSRAHRQRYCSKACSAEGRTNRFAKRWQETPEQIERGRAANRKQYKEWRRAVLERDGRKCQRCGATTRLTAHHLVAWAKEPALRFDVNNGQTLCEPCHWKHPHADVRYRRRRGDARTYPTPPASTPAAADAAPGSPPQSAD
jgi:hypothetical protein